jgi:hypothetical protein
MNKASLAGQKDAMKVVDWVVDLSGKSWGLVVLTGDI